MGFFTGFLIGSLVEFHVGRAYRSSRSKSCETHRKYTSDSLAWQYHEKLLSDRRISQIPRSCNSSCDYVFGGIPQCSLGRDTITCKTYGISPRKLKKLRDKY